MIHVEHSVYIVYILCLISGTSGQTLKKADMDGVGEVNGVPLFEYDVDAHDKPWKLPGTNLTIFVLYLYQNFLCTRS